MTVMTSESLPPPLLSSSNTFLQTTLNNEYKSFGIDQICKAAGPAINEFYHYINRLFQNSMYVNQLNATIQKLQQLYSLDTTPMFVVVEKYDVNSWGSLYWRALHYISILIQHAYTTGKIDWMLRLPTLVYNIDSILSCSICRTHYLTIKQDKTIKNALEMIAFGLPITGVFYFHNYISQNVKEKIQITYNQFDFIADYNVAPIDNTLTKSTKTYLRSPVIFESKLSANATIMLAFYNNVGWQLMSNRLRDLLKVPIDQRYIVFNTNSHLQTLSLDDLERQMHEMLHKNWQPNSIDAMVIYAKAKKQLMQSLTKS